MDGISEKQVQDLLFFGQKPINENKAALDDPRTNPDGPAAITDSAARDQVNEFQNKLIQVYQAAGANSGETTQSLAALQKQAFDFGESAGLDANSAGAAILEAYTASRADSPVASDGLLYAAQKALPENNDWSDPDKIKEADADALHKAQSWNSEAGDPQNADPTGASRTLKGNIRGGYGQTNVYGSAARYLALGASRAAMDLGSQLAGSLRNNNHINAHVATQNASANNLLINSALRTRAMEYGYANPQFSLFTDSTTQARAFSEALSQNSQAIAQWLSSGSARRSFPVTLRNPIGTVYTAGYEPETGRATGPRTQQVTNSARLYLIRRGDQILVQTFYPEIPAGAQAGAAAAGGSQADKGAGGGSAGGSSTNGDSSDSGASGGSGAAQSGVSQGGSGLSGPSGVSGGASWGKQRPADVPADVPTADLSTLEGLSEQQIQQLNQAFAQLETTNVPAGQAASSVWQQFVQNTLSQAGAAFLTDLLSNAYKNSGPGLGDIVNELRR